MPAPGLPVEPRWSYQETTSYPRALGAQGPLQDPLPPFLFHRASGKWHCSSPLFWIPANLLLPTDPQTPAKRLPRCSDSEPGSSLRGSVRESYPEGDVICRVSNMMQP